MTAPPPPPPPPLPPPRLQSPLTRHSAPPSDASLDSDDAKTLPPSVAISPPPLPPPLSPPPTSPAGTSLSRASESDEHDVDDDPPIINSQQVIRPTQPDVDVDVDVDDDDDDDGPRLLDEHQDLSDSDMDDSASEADRSDSDTYYDDIAQLTRDDPSTWTVSLVRRANAERTYESACEDDDDDDDDDQQNLPTTPRNGIIDIDNHSDAETSSLPENLHHQGVVELTDHTAHNPPQPHLDLIDDLSNDRGETTPQSPPATPNIIDLDHPQTGTVLELDDVDAALDDEEITDVTGVHEPANESEDDPLDHPYASPPSRSPRRRPPRPAVEVLPDIDDEDEYADQSHHHVEKEEPALLHGKSVPNHKRQYSQWCAVADDALSLEELEIEADEVTAAIESMSPTPKSSLVRASPQKASCRDKASLQTRVRDVTAELANVQMITAGWAADGEGKLGSSDEKGEDRLLRDEVHRLKITLNHLARLTLERAFEVRDLADAHR